MNKASYNTIPTSPTVGSPTMVVPLTLLQASALRARSRKSQGFRLPAAGPVPIDRFDLVREVLGHALAAMENIDVEFDDTPQEPTN